MSRESFFSIKELTKDRRKLTIFLICVVIASLSWLLISLGKSYSTTIIVPVKYINFPENKTLLNEVPSQLAVNLRGTGYDLLQFDERLTQDTLLVNLDNLKMSVQGDFQRGYLDQSLISNDLQKRLNGVLAINQVLTDSINFLFDLKVARIMKVKSRVRFEVANGFTLLDSVDVLPPEVEVFGALSIIDTMQYIPTEAIALGELNKSVEVAVPLSDAGFFAEEQEGRDTVKVRIAIDQLTEKRFMIEPVLLNVPDSLEMLTFPSSIELIVQIPLSRYDEIARSDFELTVDYGSIEAGYMVLPVELAGWPSIAEHVEINPKNVEIILSRIE